MSSITLEDLNERVNELTKTISLLQKDLENLVTVLDEAFNNQIKEEE